MTPTIQEDVKEDQPEDEEGLPTYPYDRLRTSSSNPVTDIDSTRREVRCCCSSDSNHLKASSKPNSLTLPHWHIYLQTYLSSAEFREKFGMTKEAFAKLPKWKQNRLKIALQLF